MIKLGNPSHSVPTGTLYFKAKIAELNDRIETLKVENDKLISKLREAEARRIDADVRRSAATVSTDDVESKLAESEGRRALEIERIHELEEQLRRLEGQQAEYESLIAELMEKRVESLSRNVKELGAEFAEEE